MRTGRKAARGDGGGAGDGEVGIGDVRSGSSNGLRESFTANSELPPCLTPTTEISGVEAASTFGAKIFCKWLMRESLETDTGGKVMGVGASVDGTENQPASVDGECEWDKRSKDGKMKV